MSQNMKSILIDIGVIAVVAIISILITIFVTSKVYKEKVKETETHMSEIEKYVIRNKSDEISDFFEDLKFDDPGSYVVYALDNAYYKEGKTTLTLKEIQEYMSNIFAEEMEVEGYGVGITPLMVDKNIVFEEESYIMKPLKKTQPEIANVPIIKYIIDDMEKISDSEFVVTYSIYKVENPYEVLNYYENKNTEENNKELENMEPVDPENPEEPREPEEIDMEEEIRKQEERNKRQEENNKKTSEILGYLKGEKNITAIKKYITKENSSEVGEKEGEVKITYILRDNEILIKEIKD